VDPRSYLESLARFGMRLGLERMGALLAELGHPERAAPAVHVVGTNGKSSTVRFCAAALTSAGERTGAYLSPHVIGWEERIQVDGEPVAADVLDSALSRVVEAVPAIEAAVGEGPTQFEVLTAAAFLVFHEAEATRLVIEAGLGGRYDASNVLAARIVGLTSIGLDHTEVLGATRELILAEKLAVVTPGALVLAGEIDDDLWQLAAETAHERGALGVRRLRADEIDAQRPRHAGYQAVNAALGLALARVARGSAGLDVEAAEAAMVGAAPPGRLELSGAAPLVLRDGAHNPDGVRALVAELDRLLGERRPRVALVGLQANKATHEMLGLLAPHVDAIVATASGQPGALHPEVIAADARELGVEAHVVADPEAAEREARARAGEAGAVLVTGSIYLLARLRAGEPTAIGRSTR
jgi:dihydrofolate synthase/folylpolyglutamate synthase